VEGSLGRETDREDIIFEECDTSIGLQVAGIDRDRLEVAAHNMGTFLSCLINVAYLVGDLLADVPIGVEQGSAILQGFRYGKDAGSSS